MKAFLMYRDRDIDPAHELSASEQALVQDLELGTLWAAMAGGDDFLLGTARQTVLHSLPSAEAITYRQHILADAIRQPDVVRQLYDLAVVAIATERRAFFGLLSKSPDSVLYRSVQVLEMFTGRLKQLRAVADEHAGSFESEGFTRLFGMLAEELDDQYLQTVEDHLKELGFRKGTLISAGLGQGNKGAGYVLRKLPGQSWRDRLAIGGQPGFSFSVADRDQAGQQALSDLRSRGLNATASALAHGLYAGKADSALFLRPERAEDGQRTFRLLPGEPLSTSYGPDLYWRIFGTPEPAASSPRAGA